MHEYRVTWRHMPFAYNSEQVLFVEAASENDAKLVAIAHLERTKGFTQDTFRIQSCAEVSQVPAGRVLGGY